MNWIKPHRLHPGDTIGICAPCYSPKEEEMQKVRETLTQMGYKVKFAKNLLSAAECFCGTREERADDFNELIHDDAVDMVLFSGGEVCNELLPFLDFESILKKPKLYVNYSDGTTLLNAIAAKTGLVTIYGVGSLDFCEPTPYTLQCFDTLLVRGERTQPHNSEWTTIRGGVCEGRLIGGYLQNFAIMQNGGYYPIDKQEKHILFWEDHLVFGNESVVTKFFAHIEQSGLMDSVTGMVVGHFADEERPLFEQLLHRLADRHNIPVVWNHDFGHGANHCLTPIGIKAQLDADAHTLTLLEDPLLP